MSNVANWSYTAKATIWHSASINEYGDRTFSPPVVIDCDYILGGTSKRITDLGLNLVIKNTYWTEYDQAKDGDYILLGEHSDFDPLSIDADEIRHITQYADTFERSADDFALITAV